MTAEPNEATVTSIVSRRLAGRDAFGDPVAWTPLRAVPDDVQGSGLLTRRVALDDGTEVLLRTPGRSRRRDVDVERLLDREIRACVRVARRYASAVGLDDVPPGLVALRAYDMDGVEPFAAVTPYRGVPARAVVPRLFGRRQQVFAADLLTALAQLTAVDMVHGALTLDALFVDGVDEPGGPRVQIVTFEHAVGVGERGTDGGVAHPGDDVLAVGRLLAAAFAADGDTDAPELNLAAVGWLHRALEGVFDSDPTARPTASEVLGRLPVRSSTALRPAKGSGLEPGHERFARLRGPAPSVERTETPTPPRPRTESGPPAGDDRPRPVAQPTVPAGRASGQARSGSTPAVVVVVLALAAVVLVAAVLLAGGR